VKRLIVLLFLTVPVFCFSQSLMVRRIDSVVSSYEKIRDVNLIMLTNVSDKKLEKEFGVSYKFRKSDNKILEVNIFLKKEPSYSYFIYYYGSDSLIKVILHSPKDTFRQFYYNNSKLVYTDDTSLKNPSQVFLKGGTTFRLLAYKYLTESNTQ
jgi:hypothetical protein